MTQGAGRTNPRGREVHDKALTAVAETLSRMRFGSIALTVHEGSVVQLDVTEKRRFDR